MSRIDVAFEFIEGIDQQREVPSLLASFRTLVARFGCEQVSIGNPSHTQIHRLDPLDRLWSAVWPEEWQQRHTIQKDHALEVALPDPDGAPDEFGGHEGPVVTIWGTDGSICAIAVGAAQHVLAKREEAALHMAALYFRAKYAELHEQTTAPKPRLTPRERECLSWVASGKTDWEISRILAISEQTTHQYVRNALTKLGAATRAQAVAVAMLERQILQ